MAEEPDCFFPDQEHPSDAEIWLQEGDHRLPASRLVRPDRRAEPDEARQLGLAFQELAGKARGDG